MNVAVIEESEVQGGRLGRLIIARLKPNEDLIDSAEALCKDHGIHLAVVRGGLGSLIDAQLCYTGREGTVHIHVEGPGVEILSVSGEIIPGDDHLAPDGRAMEILSEHTCQGWLEGYL